jgi:glutamate synthase domain-containing protein 3
MSGGVAYLWDEDGRSRARVNLDMVDLEEVLDPADEAELIELIEAHARLTGSQRASRILDTWELQLRRFVKVMPRDYRRALADLAAEAAAETAERDPLASAVAA